MQFFELMIQNLSIAAQTGIVGSCERTRQLAVPSHKDFCRIHNGTGTGWLYPSSAWNIINCHGGGDSLFYPPSGTGSVDFAFSCLWLTLSRVLSQVYSRRDVEVDFDIVCMLLDEASSNRLPCCMAPGFRSSLLRSTNGETPEEDRWR